MVQYIDKSALVAEIERLKGGLSPNFYEYDYDAAKVELLEKIEKFLDTLEVKEVDLDKEIQDSIYNRFFDLEGIAIAGSSLYATVEDMVYVAKHFFELGLKAQKGE